VPGLHPEVAAATLAQLLSHTGGLTRDGTVQGQFADARPFATREEILADLAEGPTIPSSTRFKYSNHGFALVGMAIEAATGMSWHDWLVRDVLVPFGLNETLPDAPIPAGTPVARGHTAKAPVGRRLVIPGDNPGHAVAPAGGVVSTAADLVRFFAQLSPGAPASPLPVASRREMTRRQWRSPDTSVELWYGLGTMSGTVGGTPPWTWFGHPGRLQGYVSRTGVVAEEALAVSVLVNAVDGVPEAWLDGALRILRLFRTRGAPSAAVRGWTGRYWSLWGAVDLLPAGDRVLMAAPAQADPLMDAAEIEVGSGDAGRIALAPGFGSHGEPVRLLRDAAGAAAGIEMGGLPLLPEADVVRTMCARWKG
jgi:CubicO group peptidase (beta-lactamase class C family)